MKRDFQLLAIDPQNDFCDLPEDFIKAHADGQELRPALPVPGAHRDMLTLADLVRRGADGLSAITETVDSHHRYDIAHPTFWRDAQGEAVAPFTEITAAEVRAGRYVTTEPDALPRALRYLDALESAGRYRLMVWPIHCVIGSWGQQTHAELRAAFDAWEQRSGGRVHAVYKGRNPWTEHYSALLAEVPDPDDPDTQLNTPLIARLAAADRVYIAGEAGSHCVRATTEHLVANFAAENCSKLVLLTDCMSPVSGFEAQQQAFVEAMRRLGVRTATSAEALAELLDNAR